jgi:hypothetical protein
VILAKGMRWASGTAIRIIAVTSKAVHINRGERKLLNAAMDFENMTEHWSNLRQELKNCNVCHENHMTGLSL